MATPFFGKRDMDTASSLTSPTNLRSTPTNIRGEFSGKFTVHQKLVIEEGGQLAGEILFGAIGTPAKTPALAPVGGVLKTA